MPKTDATTERIEQFCHHWTLNHERDPERALWATLAHTPAHHQAAIEAWLYKRMREVNPGWFPSDD